MEITDEDLKAYISKHWNMYVGKCFRDIIEERMTDGEELKFMISECMSSAIVNWLNESGDEFVNSLAMELASRLEFGVCINKLNE